MLPTAIVRIATGTKIAAQFTWNPEKAMKKTLPRTANPAAFGPTDMKAVTDVGAPSYTSGAHMWKGAAAILKPKATTKRIIERKSAGFVPIPWAARYPA